MDKTERQDREIGEFLSSDAFYNKMNSGLYELTKAVFKAGWEKGEEYARENEE